MLQLRTIPPCSRCGNHSFYVEDDGPVCLLCGAPASPATPLPYVPDRELDRLPYYPRPNGHHPNRPKPLRP